MPYKSQAQRKFFHTDTARQAGITPATIKEFDQAGKDIKLPKKQPKRKWWHSLKEKKCWGEIMIDVTAFERLLRSKAKTWSQVAEEIGAHPGLRAITVRGDVVRNALLAGASQKWLTGIFALLPSDVCIMDDFGCGGRLLHLKIDSGGAGYMDDYVLIAASREWETLKDGSTIPELVLEKEMPVAFGKWKVIAELPRAIRDYLCERCENKWQFPGSNPPLKCPACGVEFEGMKTGFNGEPNVMLVAETEHKQAGRLSIGWPVSEDKSDICELCGLEIPMGTLGIGTGSRLAHDKCFRRKTKFQEFAPTDLIFLEEPPVTTFYSGIWDNTLPQSAWTCSNHSPGLEVQVSGERCEVCGNKREND